MALVRTRAQFWQVKSEYRAIQQRVAARACSQMAKWVLVAGLLFGQLMLGGKLWDWETRFLESPNLAWFVLAGFVCCAADICICGLVCDQHADDSRRYQKWTAEMKRRHLVEEGAEKEGAEKEGAEKEGAEKEGAVSAATALFNGRESIEVP
eukprot:SAG31_NODE_117_length_24022_cov_6.878067_6_plen_152_part_00